MYKSTNRVFSYDLEYEKMKEMLESRGYTIITAIQALKRFDKDIMKKVYVKYGYDVSGLKYSFAYKKSEEEQFFCKFTNIIEKINDPNDTEIIFYGKYYWLHESELYNNIVDVKIMSIIKKEFEEQILKI